MTRETRTDGTERSRSAGAAGMTSPSSPTAGSTTVRAPERPIVRAQTLPLQQFVNVVVRGLLRAPFVGRALGRRLVTVYVVGRRSGRRYSVPVAYVRHDGSLLVGSQFPWVRNLRSGDPVDIRLAGRRRSADVRVLNDESDVVERLAIMARDNHQFAKFNRIRIDRNGEPVSEDLHLAWAAGARVAVLTTR